MTTSSSRPLFQELSVVIGPVVALLTAAVLSLPQRDDSSGLTLANVALVMAVVTVGFALVNGIAGATTSVTAALALNYFHTEPYRTLRVNDRRDVYSIVLLAALGLAVSALTTVRVRLGIASIHHNDTAIAGEELARSLDKDQPASQVWARAMSASANDLGLVTARVERHVPYGVPMIHRRVTPDSDSTLRLPEGGAGLELGDGRCLILTPRSSVGAVTLDRGSVVAFADTLERSLQTSTRQGINHG